MMMICDDKYYLNIPVAWTKCLTSIVKLCQNKLRKKSWETVTNQNKNDESFDEVYMSKNIKRGFYKGSFAPFSQHNSRKFCPSKLNFSSAFHAIKVMSKAASTATKIILYNAFITILIIEQSQLSLTSS